MPSYGNCAICLTHYTLDKFLAFACGHCFCSTCVDSLLNPPRPKCPHCRAAIHRRDVHPIYIEVVESHVAAASTITEGLQQMNKDTPSISVKRASQKLDRALQSLPEDESTLALLLQAVNDFRERIVPVFEEKEQEKAKTNELRQNLLQSKKDKDALHKRLKSAESRINEIHRLENDLEQKESNLQQALSLAERAKEQMETYSARLDSMATRTLELEEENKRNKDTMDRQAHAVRVQREKNKRLAKENEDLKALLAIRTKEKEPHSDATQGYDGDYSSHEASTSITSIQTATPTRGHRHPVQTQDQNRVTLDMEGIPKRSFTSDWQLPPPLNSRKRPSTGPPPHGHRRVANPFPSKGFPIDVDRRGHTLRPVQVGPKSTLSATPR